MISITLPPCTGTDTPPSLPDSRRLTLVGAPGAGKTRFMNAMVESCGPRACTLSAVSARFPERNDAESLPGSVDSLYRQAAALRPYMRTDAVSPLDKLSFMLMADEFDRLLSMKADWMSGKKAASAHVYTTTPLDKVARIWERIFPGNRIVPSEGHLMFATSSGDDLIPLSSLSEGEAAVLYWLAAALYAPHGSVLFINSPSLFLHPSIVTPLWDAVEDLRRDCIFVYDGVDADFVSSRTRNVIIWIKSYVVDLHAWDYEVIPSGRFSDQLFVDLMGTRKPVLFIEGDALHSIDAKLYPLVFSDYTVSPLGSCNKVIETVRTFNDMKGMHHLDSRGIVDRDRRTDEEVGYLRRKNIYVPEVAEVENIFLLEPVIRTMAAVKGRDPDAVFSKVKKEVLRMFHAEYKAQALQHVRHRVKREVETKIDARFTCITALETHLSSLVNKLRPREAYEELLSSFHNMLVEEDYPGILRVFNHKPMLANCGVSQLLGYSTKEAYVEGVISVLRGSSWEAGKMRHDIKLCFGLSDDEEYVVPLPPPPSKKKFTRSAPSASTESKAANESAEVARHKKRSRAKVRKSAKRKARARTRGMN